MNMKRITKIPIKHNLGEKNLLGPTCWEYKCIN